MGVDRKGFNMSHDSTLVLRCAFEIEVPMLPVPSDMYSMPTVRSMATQGRRPVDHSMSPHVISSAFVPLYYQILHEHPEEAYKFYHDSSILGRPDSNETMLSVTTLAGINEKILSMDFKNCLIKIETADPQLSHNDGVLIVVTGSLTSNESICRGFTQSFFLAPQESGGYFVLNDVFRFIPRRQQDEINQVVSQENECKNNVVSTFDMCSSLQEPTSADKSLISDHASIESNVSERQVINPTAIGNITKKNTIAESPVQVAKEDPKKGHVIIAATTTTTDAVVAAPIQIDVANHWVKIMKERLLAPPVANVTPSGAKHKPTFKPVKRAVEGLEKSSTKPTKANEGDRNIAKNNSSHDEEGYSIFVKRLPFNATIQMVEEEFKKFGAIKPRGIQVVRHVNNHFCFGFIEYESRHSMQAAIEACPVHMGGKEVYVEQKRTPTRVVNGAIITVGRNDGGGYFQSRRRVYYGGNFRGQGGSYMDIANYRGVENYNQRNDGEYFNYRYDGENFKRGNNNGENYNGRNGGENYNRKNSGENYNYRKGRENYNQRIDNENYNRRSDNKNYNKRTNGENYNQRSGDENYNRRMDDIRYKHRAYGGNFSRMNDGGNYSRMNVGGNLRRNDDENFNRQNDFRNHNEFSGRGRGPPSGDSYQHNNNCFHPSQPIQNGNGRLPRGNGPNQLLDAI
ncbi:hypothetical protein ACP4OV_012337 [Aristida adscensionis]